jgi:hypothetical protein
MKHNTPNKYAANETLTRAYAKGYNHGHGIACHNVPDMGAHVWTEDMGRMVVNRENIRDIHQSFCFQAESNSRQYSPFEFTAHEFNSLGNGDECEGGEELSETTSEEAWEAFEEGVSDAILADLATYTDEDYGIEPETNETE